MKRYTKRVNSYILNQLQNPKKVHRWMAPTAHKFRNIEPHKWLGGGIL